MDRTDALRALGMDDVEGVGSDPNDAQTQKGNGGDDGAAMADDDGNEQKKEEEMVDEDDVREQELADEKYHIWKKNAPLLYDVVIVCFPSLA